MASPTKSRSCGGAAWALVAGEVEGPAAADVAHGADTAPGGAVAGQRPGHPGDSDPGFDGAEGNGAIVVVASVADIDEAAGCDRRALLKSMAWPIFRGALAIGKDH